ncbi:FadR/GntR family transcriptional regulator [Burkholderia sp. GS2Y]|uniref:FCD domain-containing protein n=1 Tax=Burkholderia theae TaxID=3143496 RepID=A0ABU9WRY5_9BURK
MTEQELRSLTDWRRAISGEASYLAAMRGSPQDFFRIRDAADEFMRCYDHIARRRVADARLHTLIAEISQSSDLLREEIQIQERLNILILPQPTPSLVKNTRTMRHDALVSAIVGRDADGARQEMIEHVESTYDWSCTLLKTSGV